MLPQFKRLLTVATLSAISFVAQAQDEESGLIHSANGDKILNVNLIPGSASTIVVSGQNAPNYTAPIILTKVRNLDADQVGEFYRYEVNLLVNNKVETLVVVQNMSRMPVSFSVPQWNEGKLNAFGNSANPAAGARLDLGNLDAVVDQTRALVHCRTADGHEILVSNPSKEMMSVFVDNDLYAYKKINGTKYVANAPAKGGQYRFDLGAGKGLVIDYAAEKSADLVVSVRGKGEYKCAMDQSDFAAQQMLKVVSRSR